MSILIGCTDNTSLDSTGPNLQGKSALKIYLTDSPSSLDSVIIFVKEVQVHKTDSESEGWITVNDSLRKFDLLELRNGASIVLGDSILDAGKYSQIRLILIDENYVVDNGLKHHLTVPSGLQTGIKLNHEFTLEPNTLYELMLDFNVDKSIHVTGNGKYMMKPVIRCTPMIISGSISGVILPLDAQATVFTTFNSDTISTYPDANGQFKLMALPADNYNIEIYPQNNAYKDTIVANINVFANQNTVIDTVELKLK
jgi:hypothetical protein